MNQRRASTNLGLCSTTTCIYLSVIFIFLIYWNELYDIGKYRSGTLIVVLFILETLKYLYSSNTRVQCWDLKHFAFSAVIFVKSVFLYYVITVLMGAEVFNQFEGTLMFSILLSVLTTLPVCLHLGKDFFPNIVFYEHTVLSRYLMQNCAGVYLGSYLGAFVIPLDWDRPWQLWPIPCCVGALIGYFISNLLIFFQICNCVNKKSLY